MAGVGEPIVETARFDPDGHLGPETLDVVLENVKIVWHIMVKEYFSCDLESPMSWLAPLFRRPRQEPRLLLQGQLFPLMAAFSHDDIEDAYV